MRWLCKIPLLAVGCLSLTSCVNYQITTPSTGASVLSSTHQSTNVTVSNGILSVQLNDPAIKDADIRRTQFVEAVLTTDAGKQIPLKLWGTNYGDGVTFLFRIKDSGFDGSHFGLHLTTSLDGKAATIAGSFTIQDEGRLISWHDLDRG
jgi:hypothetical protein